MRLVDIKQIVALCIGIIVYAIIRPYIRVSMVVALAIIYISINNQFDVLTQTNNVTPNSRNTQSLMQTLQNTRDAFFNEQKIKQVEFGKQAGLSAPFDLLFLSICSLSWDDLRLVGLESHPLLKRFDITFTQYNSATSYSGPAVIRLLRAGCGQESHPALFKPSPLQSCYLFENLAALGFKNQLIMNHNGTFDNFTDLIKEQGHLNVEAQRFTSLPPYQSAFDKSIIYRDSDILSRWFSTQASDISNHKSVTLYNTISLHDGNQFINGNRQANLTSYKKRLSNLLDDLDMFFNRIEKSGRNMVVVFIPEHGAGMRGDKLQISGIRDIPSPSIVNVPVGITLFGKSLKRTGLPVSINTPTSHLALSQVISNILDTDLYSSGQYDPQLLIENIPTTSLVAQNEDATLLRFKGKDYITLDEKTWSEYPSQ
jgi:cellulose synthase operon protein YhjU